MRFFAAIAFVSLLIAAPIAAATDWVAEGGNAARRYASPDEGPRGPEVAFQIALEGLANLEPVVLGRSAFVLAQGGVVRIDLDGATATKVGDTPFAVQIWSDGTRVFVQTILDVRAYSPGGDLLWSTPFPALDRPPSDLAGRPFTYCGPAIAVQERVVLGCRQAYGDTVIVVTNQPSFSATLDAATGSIEVSYTPRPGGFVARTDDTGAALLGTAIVRDSIEYVSSGGLARHRLNATDLATGRVAWEKGNQPDRDVDPAAPDPAYAREQGGTGAGSSSLAQSTGTSTFAASQYNGISFFDLATGSLIWREASPDSNSQLHFALRANQLLVAGGTSLRLLDPATRTSVEVANLSAEFWQQLVVAKNALHAVSCETDTHAFTNHAEDSGVGGQVDRVPRECKLRAYSFDGRLEWVFPFKSKSYAQQSHGAAPFALSDGVIVLVSHEPDVVTVLGHTAASIQLLGLPAETYPAVREIITLDLSASRPGALGAATEYSVDWGDGSRDDWQTAPTFRHAFGTAGDSVATISARNTADQSSIAQASFHVGASPPVDANFVSRQFDNEHQNATFFLLGLAITGLVALFGIVRLRRRRGLLAREMTELEAAAEATRANPRALDGVLGEWRLRARALLMGGSLDEGQHAVLLARVEELSRRGRLDFVDQILDFLPHRHVRALREMLQDGRITSLERAHYLAMLDGDSTLTSEYKARVRAVVDEWARHDAGGGA